MSNSFIKAFFVYGASAGLSRILPLVMLPFYLHALGADNYGKVEIIIALFNLLIIFGLMQFETGIQRLFYKFETKEVLLTTTVVMTLFCSFVIASISILFASDISKLLFQSEIEKGLVVVAALTIFFANLSSINLVYIRFCERVLAFSIISITQVVITAGFSYLYIVELNYGPLGYLLGIALGWVYTWIMTTVYICITSNIRFEFDRSCAHEIFLFSVPQLPARLASFFFQFGNRFFILAYLGASAVAQIALAFKFAAGLQLIMFAFSMVWNPFIYKNENKGKLQENINKIFKCILAALLVLHLITIVLAEKIIKIFFEDDFLATIDYVGLALFSVELLIVKEIVETGVKLSSKTSRITYAYLISFSVMFLLMWFSRSIEHILWAGIAGNFLLVALTWYFSERNYYVTFSKSAFLIYMIASGAGVFLHNVLLSGSIV